MFRQIDRQTLINYKYLMWNKINNRIIKPHFTNGTQTGQKYV